MNLAATNSGSELSNYIQSLTFLAKKSSQEQIEVKRMVNANKNALRCSHSSSILQGEKCLDISLINHDLFKEILNKLAEMFLIYLGEILTNNQIILFD